ncbi:hypothetical protein [Sphingobacterium hungaricum]
MAKPITRYSIFLASPSDLDYERTEIKGLIEELNLTWGNTNNIHLDLFRRETHSAPAITNSYTQNIINQDLGEEYDLFIGMLWKKFGTPTESANSGTEEEFLKAVERYKRGDNIQIMIYFRTGQVDLLELDPIQYRKVLEFKETLPETGVFYSSFSSIQEFGNQIRIHIPKRISELKENDNKKHRLSNVDSSLKFDEVQLVPSEEDLGFFDYMIAFDTHLWLSTNALNSINTATEEVGALINAKTDELNILNNTRANSNQYVQHFQILSKVILDYVQKLKIETPNFYENFESSIKTGLKFINTFSVFDKEDYKENLEKLYFSSIVLKENIPGAIEGMKGFQRIVRNLPKIQSNLNYAARQLDSELSDLISKLNNSYRLIFEFLSDIELRIKSIE